MLGRRPRRLRRVARRQLPSAVQNAPLDELVEARFAQRVPSLVEAALVLCDVLVVRVQRPVRRGVRDVLEEGRPRMLARVLVEGLFSRAQLGLELLHIGEVLPAPMDVVLDYANALVVQPDLLFVSNDRREIITDRVYGAPDMVVEVLSPRPRIGKLDERVA